MATSEQQTEVPELATAFRDDIDSIKEECMSLIRSAVTESGKNGVVVGLSGGIDSTTTATLAVEALGKEDVYGLVIPADASDSSNIKDAQDAAFELGINYRTVNVQPILEELTNTMEQEYRLRQMAALSFVSGEAVGLCDPVQDRDGYTEAIGNATARIRMMAMYFEANLRDRLVLGTGNRTEIALGYFTKYGDGGVDLQPLGHLYKTEVRRLARHLDVPQDIVEKQPTAGLWEGQTDSDDLGAPYTIIDAVLQKLVDEGCSVERTSTELGVDPDLVAKYDEMYQAAAHKRDVPPTPETHVS